MAVVERRLQQAECHNGAGEWQEAAMLYRRVLGERPGHATALFHLGTLLLRQGKPAEALPLLEKLAATDSRHAAAWNNLGLTLQKLGRLEEATTHYRRALELSPCYADALNNLGTIAHDQGRADEAMRCFERVLDIDVRFASAHYNLGNCLKALDRPEEAIACYDRALALHRDAAALNNKGLCLMLSRNDVEGAKDCFEQALVLEPGNADGHWNRALALLRAGRLAEAWPDFEWRFQIAQSAVPYQRPEPLWDGSPLAGKTLLVHAEQGLGDTFQFVRYLPAVKAQGGRVVFECQHGLASLLQNGGSFDALIERTVANESVVTEPIDVQIPLLSLPGLCGTPLETVPADVPYLWAEPERIECWRARLAREKIASDALKVGIVWAGQPGHLNDHRRSCALEQFAALAGVPDVCLLSLQKGTAAGQAADPPPGLALIDLGAEMEDFADTAAIMAHLDLVISVDTSVAHLAGALGRPVWTLLPFVPDWRWMLAREDSPWYPTMRLFRQTLPGDWPAVFARVALELEAIQARRRLEAGEREEAKRRLLALSERAPDHTGILNSLGVLYWQGGALEPALQMFLRALQADPHDRTTVMNCADVFQAFGKEDEAAVLRAGLKREPVEKAA